MSDKRTTKIKFARLTKELKLLNYEFRHKLNKAKTQYYENLNKISSPDELWTIWKKS